MPAACVNASAPSREVIVPAPTLSLPGLALALAISSAIVFGPSLRVVISEMFLVRQGDRREILLRIVGQIGHHQGIHHHGDVHGDEQRVAVGRRLRHQLGADRGIAAGAVLDHHRLPPMLGHFRTHDAGDGVGRAAGRERHDHADGVARIIFCCQRPAPRPKTRRSGARQLRERAQCRTCQAVTRRCNWRCRG